MSDVTLADYLTRVSARRAALGMSASARDIEAMRNKGSSRTPAKRELLRRAEARAKAAGPRPSS